MGQSFDIVYSLVGILVISSIFKYYDWLVI